MMKIFKESFTIIKLRKIRKNFIYKSFSREFSNKEIEKVSFELSEDKMKNLYNKSKTILKEEKKAIVENNILKDFLKLQNFNTGENDDSLNYDLVGSGKVLDEIINKKFNEKRMSLEEIDKIYEQTQTEEIDLFEKLGTNFYDEEYDFNNLKEQTNNENFGMPNDTDFEDLESIIDSTLQNNKILNFKKENQNLTDNKNLMEKNKVTNPNENIIKSNQYENGNMNTFKDTENNKKVSNRRITKKNNKNSKKSNTININQLDAKDETNITDHNSITKQNLIDNIEVLIPKSDSNQQHNDFNLNLQNESINKSIQNNIEIKENFFTNPKEGKKLDDLMDDDKGKIIEQKSEESHLTPPVKKPSKKSVSKKAVNNLEGNRIITINEYLKSLNIYEFDYYNNTDHFGSELSDLTQIKHILESYIFNIEKPKKKVLIENLDEFLIQNMSIKETNLNYIVSVFKKNFLHFHLENIEYLKKKINGIRKLTFVFSDKSQRGLIKKDLGGLYIYGDENQIGSFFFNYGKVPNNKITQLLLIFQNLIIHELITRDSNLNIDSLFVYTKKYDFDKNLSSMNKGRDYLQICLRNMIRQIIIYKKSKKENIKFYTHTRLFSKKFKNDFQYTNDDVIPGNVCFQHN